MKNTILAGVIASAFATGAFAGSVTDPVVDTPVTTYKQAGPVLGGSINLELSENAAGDFVATTTFGVGITVEGLAFGSASVESIDGETVELDSWHIGTHIGAATLSFGKQGDLMVGNDFEIVGGDTLADVADDHESLKVAVAGAEVMLGFTDITADVTDIENVQAAYSLGIGAATVTAVGDYNLDSEDWTVGAKAGMSMGDIGLGGIVTYGSATEVFAYEASASYSLATVFVNGDQDDAFQNLGAGLTYDVRSNLNVYAEGAYNIDSEDTTIGAGVSFNF